jgi:WhiB family transcriptional regulator, redox-sensing transcriptional regulator
MMDNAVGPEEDKAPGVEHKDSSPGPGTQVPGPVDRHRWPLGTDWDLTEILPERPVWHSLAACRGVGPQTFFPRADDRRPASDRRYKFGLKYCRDCPVAAECRAAGEGEVFGLWGGLTPTERAGRRAKAG